MRLAAGGHTAWIVVPGAGQHLRRVGLLPITGVPLPLVSEGLSSLLVTMVALGMLMSFAKRNPAPARPLPRRAPEPGCAS